MEKLDCFAYDEKFDGNCKALQVPRCQGETCPFYKSNKQYADEMKRLYGRRTSNVESTDTRGN